MSKRVGNKKPVVNKQKVIDIDFDPIDDVKKVAKKPVVKKSMSKRIGNKKPVVKKVAKKVVPVLPVVPVPTVGNKVFIINGRNFIYKNRRQLLANKKYALKLSLKDLSTYFNEGKQRVVEIGKKKFIIDITENNDRILARNGYKGVAISKKWLINGIETKRIKISKLNTITRKEAQEIDREFISKSSDFWTKEEFDEFHRVRLLMKPRREIFDNMKVIRQNSPVEIDYNMKARDFFDGEFDDDNDTWTGKIRNPANNFFDDYYHEYLDLVHSKLHGLFSITRAEIQMIYYTCDPSEFTSKKPNRNDKEYHINLKKYNATLDEIGKVYHTKPVLDFSKNINPLEMVFDFAGNVSNFIIVVVGYRLIYHTRNDKDLGIGARQKLKAFKDCKDKKFFDYTCGSSRVSGLCIYETFLDILGIRKLLQSHSSDKALEKLSKLLHKEGKYIEDAVRNGELYRALEFLTKKYKTKIIIIYYGTLFYKNRKNEIDLEYDQHLPTITENGITREINSKKELEKYNGQKIMLYKKDIHVAPSYFYFHSEEEIEKPVENVTNKFVLEPEYLDKKKFETMKAICNILGYDFETFCNEQNIAIPFCCNVYGMFNGREFDKCFYGIGCEKVFAEWINANSPNQIPSKKEKNKMIHLPKVYIYGFNNSRFDNILLWERLYEISRDLKITFASTTIKNMSLGRMNILDISAFYKVGSLRETAKSFKLEEEKEFYPYTFPNKDNLQYKGEIPELKYWNNVDDLNGYNKMAKQDYADDLADFKCGYNKIKPNPKQIDIFDLEKYTKKYCRLDAKLVYDMAVVHLQNCRGVIEDAEGNKRYYDVSSCITSAGLSLKMFQQGFLSRKLYQSPDNIIVKEKLGYKGGRTEVFKREFRRNKNKLFYLDINSSYPASMTQNMPTKYLDTINYDNKKIKRDEIVPTNLYLSSTKYIGTNDYFISNILMRDSLTQNIISCKNSEYCYNWGCELIEAIDNKCEVRISEENRYEKGAIFKEFAEYFYNKRLIEKNNNPALAQFLKTVMNSLYGKFGQRVFNKTIVCESNDDLLKYLQGDSKIFIDYKICNNKIIAEFETFGLQYESIGKLMRFSSYIAALSRCNLSEVMRDVGHENIYYCDTDSVFSTKMPSEKYISQTELGLWKLEGRPIKKAIFLAPKMYMYEEEDLNEDEDIEIIPKISKTAKGITAKKLTVKDYDDLNNGTIENKSQDNTMFIRSLENVKIITASRRVKPVLNKRIWDENNSSPYENIEAWRASKK